MVLFLNITKRIEVRSLLSYNTFMKHAKVVTDSIVELTDRKQVLKGVKHFEDGSAAVTDSYRMYFAKDIHDRTDEAVLTPNGKVLDVDYPNVKRLLEVGYPKQELSLPVVELLEAADLSITAGRLVSNGVVSLYLKDNFICFESPLVKYRKEFANRFEVSLHLNAQYLLEALKLFKEAKCAEVKVSLFGEYRPIFIESENLIVIILPIKKR